MSAPGPANVTMAKAALAAAGLKEGDYSWTSSTWASMSTR